MLPRIALAVDWAEEVIVGKGGRLVYLGAGTSGRLGVLDASECAPTFGTDRIVGILAGAPASLTSSLEGVEDDSRQAVRDLKKVRFTGHDVLVGISASGGAPYVLAGMNYARSQGAKAVGLTCNPDAPLKACADVAIIPVVGPEVIAGSSRLEGRDGAKTGAQHAVDCDNGPLRASAFRRHDQRSDEEPKALETRRGNTDQPNRYQSERCYESIEEFPQQSARSAVDGAEKDLQVRGRAPTRSRREHRGRCA